MKNNEAKKINEEFLALYRKIYRFLRNEWDLQKVALLKNILRDSMYRSTVASEPGVEDQLLLAMKTAVIVMDEIGLKQPTVGAVFLFHAVSRGHYDISGVKDHFGEEVETILRGLIKVNEFSDKKSAVESENYMKLLLSMAEDIRVVFIMIAQHLQKMRDATFKDQSTRLALSVESSYLYAPLAHRLGLYTIKSELEDLSLKYTDRETYDYIAQKLNETKRSRDKYSEFIKPAKRLDKTGLKHDIKGRTKSIYSINKLKKQKVEFEDIYDLAIVLFGSPRTRKAQCWQVYSIITDMYQPNPRV